MAHPAPTPAFNRRSSPLAGSLHPSYLRREERILARCENCQTKTLTETLYVDQYGRSTTCTTTKYRTAYQTDYQTDTNTYAATQLVPLPSPTTAIPLYSTVYYTMTSTIAAATTAAAVTPPSLPSSGSGWTLPGNVCSDCGCEAQWAKVLLGGIPHGTTEVLASIVFFFPFVLFFVVTAIRIKTWGGDKDMFFFLTPLLLFFAVCLSAVATRAYSSTNESTPHYLAQHVLISVAPPVLVEVAVQLYSLLSKRALPGGWIDASSLFLRFLNVVALVLYAVAAGATVSFVNGWMSGSEDCSSRGMTKLSVLNLVADILELLILVGGAVCLFLARWRLRMETGVLVIQYLLYAAFAFHFVWRFLHDADVAKAWSGRTDRTCSPTSALTTAPAEAHNLSIDWLRLRAAANAGMNGSPVYWLLGILPLFMAATLLMAVNLLRYVTAIPPPVAEPDSVRYKLCYNENSKKMEFQRLDNPGGPVLPNGDQLYELVRDQDGEGWAIREARVPTVLPGWQNVTFSPWYR